MIDFVSVMVPLCTISSTSDHGSGCTASTSSASNALSPGVSPLARKRWITSSVKPGVVQIEVMVLSPRRSRLRTDLEIKPKTLAARLFVNTMRLAKGRVQARFEKGLTQLGARIKDRYDRQA